jgi:hypothetical protein
VFRNGYLGLFWASYVYEPEDRAIHFIGRSAGDARPRWVRAVTPAHGIDAAHPPPGPLPDLKLDRKFPLTLVSGRSRYTYAEPWYYGVCRGRALVQMFRASDRVWFAQSPNGGSVTSKSPAWDFQWFVPGYKVGKAYGLVMRAAYVPYKSQKQVQELTRRHRDKLNPTRKEKLRLVPVLIWISRSDSPGRRRQGRGPSRRSPRRRGHELAAAGAGVLPGLAPPAASWVEPVGLHALAGDLVQTEWTVPHGRARHFVAWVTSPAVWMGPSVVKKGEDARPRRIGPGRAGKLASDQGLTAGRPRFQLAGRRPPCGAGEIPGADTPRLEDLRALGLITERLGLRRTHPQLGAVTLGVGTA